MLFEVCSFRYLRAKRENPELLRYRDKIVDALRRLTIDDEAPKLVDPHSGDAVELWSQPTTVMEAILFVKSQRVILDSLQYGTRSWFRFPEDTMFITIVIENTDEQELTDRQRREQERYASPEELRKLYLALTTWVRQPRIQSPR